MTTPDADHGAEVPTPAAAPQPWFKRALAFLLAIEIHWRLIVLLVILAIAFFLWKRGREALGGLLSLGQGPVTATPGNVVSKPDSITYPGTDGRLVTRRVSPDADRHVNTLSPGPGLPKGGTEVKPEEWGFVLDPLVGASWGPNPILPSVGARFFFLGPDFGASALVEAPVDLFDQPKTRGGLLVGPDFRTGNVDLMAGVHLGYQDFLDPRPPSFGFSIAFFPCSPPGKTILHNPPAP